MRAGPVRSLPRNRGGNRRRPREVEASERVVSPVVEVAEEGYGHRVGSAPRVYIAAVAASRESSTGSSYTTPTASFFRGFGFRFGHPFAGTRRFSPSPVCPIPLFLSLHLTLPFLFSVTSFSPLPVSLVFRSFPFANRCLSLARVATFGRTWWRTPCACGLYGRLRVPRLLIFVVVLAGTSSFTDYSRSC